MYDLQGTKIWVLWGLGEKYDQLPKTKKGKRGRGSGREKMKIKGKE